MALKDKLKAVWDFLWNSNSFWSWLVDIVLMLLIVKFIIFPLFSLGLGTPLPFVIIESGSMTHEGSFDSWYSLHGSWYTENNISKDDMKGWPWKNGLYKGDIIIVRGLKAYDYKKGDVIIFKVQGQGTPVIHRVIDIRNVNGSTMFTTKGDHNDGQLPYEHDVKDEQVVGKAAARIPWLGWVKLFFVELFR